MGAIKDIASAVGNIIDRKIERDQKIDAMHREIMLKSYGLDTIEARKVAAVLVDRAEVTWK